MLERGEFQRHYSPVLTRERGGAGYIVNNATSACEYCAYKVGDQFYAALDMSFDNRWRDLGISIVFIRSNLIFLLLNEVVLILSPFVYVYKNTKFMIASIPEFQSKIDV